MDLDSKRMLDKEEEEEEGQTSRGSPVIGKCLHWQLYSEHDLWRVIFDTYILQHCICTGAFLMNIILTGASASNCDSGISDGSPGPQVGNPL